MPVSSANSNSQHSQSSPNVNTTIKQENDEGSTKCIQSSITKLYESINDEDIESIQLDDGFEMFDSPPSLEEGIDTNNKDSSLDIIFTVDNDSNQNATNQLSNNSQPKLAREQQSSQQSSQQASNAQSSLETEGLLTSLSQKDNMFKEFPGIVVDTISTPPTTNISTHVDPHSSIKPSKLNFSNIGDKRKLSPNCNDEIFVDESPPKRTCTSTSVSPTSAAISNNKTSPLSGWNDKVLDNTNSPQPFSTSPSPFQLNDTTELETEQEERADLALDLDFDFNSNIIPTKSNSKHAFSEPRIANNRGSIFTSTPKSNIMRRRSDNSADEEIVIGGFNKKEKSTSAPVTPAPRNIQIDVSTLSIPSLTTRTPSRDWKIISYKTPPTWKSGNRILTEEEKEMEEIAEAHKRGESNTLMHKKQMSYGETINKCCLNLTKQENLDKLHNFLFADCEIIEDGDTIASPKAPPSLFTIKDLEKLDKHRSNGKEEAEENGDEVRASVATRKNSSSELTGPRKKLVCLSAVYLYDCTSFRMSEFMKVQQKQVESQSKNLHDLCLGITLLCVGSKQEKAPKQPFFLPLPALSSEKYAALSQDSPISFDMFTENEEEVKLLQQCFVLLDKLLHNSNILKVSYQLQDLLKLLVPFGVSISKAQSLHDVKVAGWLWDPDGSSEKTQTASSDQNDQLDLSFEKLASYYLNIPPSSLQSTSVFSKNIQNLHFDLLMCCRLLRVLLAKLKSEDLLAIYEEEMKLCPIIAKMESRGIQFSSSALAKHKERLNNYLSLLDTQAQLCLGRRIHLASNAEVAMALFSELALPHPFQGQKSKKGLAKDSSTNDKVLYKLTHLHELPGIVLKHRKCMKMLNTYILPLSSYATADNTCRIHSTWVHTGTRTGRISCQAPNLQGLPKNALNLPAITKSDTNQASSTTIQPAISINIRDAFVAKEGYLLISADYSQLEMRVLAYISGDRFLNSFLDTGKDIHLLIASHWLSKPVEQVTSLERERAKKIGYAIVYGIGARSLGGILGVSSSQAAQFKSSFIDKFPQLKIWMQEALEQARRTKSVRTLLNRRRILRDISSIDAQKRNKSERQAINTPIQGTASDIVKLAMISIDTCFSSYKPSASSKARCIGHLVLNVHDELVYEVKEELKVEAIEIIRNEMEKVMTTKIARASACGLFPVTVHCGKQLGSLQLVPNASFNERGSVFSQILNGRIQPNFILLKSKEACCILSHAPTQLGHCIIFPNDPVMYWEDIPLEVHVAILMMSKLICKTLKAVYNCDAVLSVVGSHQEQIGHAHCHLIPQKEQHKEHALDTDNVASSPLNSLEAIINDDLSNELVITIDKFVGTIHSETTKMVIVEQCNKIRSYLRKLGVCGVPAD